MRKLTFLTLALTGTLAVMLFSASSCDSGLEVADMYMDMRIMPGGEAYDVASTYEINGTRVNLELIRLYLSEVGLKSADGTNALTSEVVLVDPSQTLYPVGQVLAGDYTGARFTVGLTPEINNSDPSNYEIGSPLGPQSPSLHWSWEMGWIWVRVDGTYDSDGDDIPDTPFEVHFGTNQFLTTVELNGNYTAEKDGEVTLMADFDPIVLFDGIDFPTENTTHVGDNLPMAQSVFANIGAAFSAR